MGRLIPSSSRASAQQQLQCTARAAGREDEMSWRRLRSLTLVLLGLLIAAPLGSGDKGLWLSLVATPAQILDLAADRLPAEHSILLPERASRIARAATVARP